MSENRIRKVKGNLVPALTKPGSGPASAGICYDSGYNYLGVNPDGTERAFPETFTVNCTLEGAQPATAANYGVFYTAPYGVTVVGVTARWATASSSGTLMINKAPSGTAIGSGTAVLASTVNTAGTANTNTAGTLHATAANLALAAGDSLGLVNGGTLTSLAHLSVTVTLKRTPSVA